MNSRDVLRKVKNCLALSKSSNEHEAATALKQAQALMFKYSLSELDIYLSDIKNCVLDTDLKRKREVEIKLAMMVAEVFECGFYISQSKQKGQTRKFVFYGLSPNVEIAVYAYEVLDPVLKEARKLFISSLHGNTKLKSKRILGTNFCLGWINSVKNKCENINPNQNLKDILKKYEEEKLSLKVFSFPKSSHYNKDKLNQAFYAGKIAGNSVNLFNAVNTVYKDELIYQAQIDTTV